MGNFNFKKMPSHLYKFVLPKPKTLEGLPEYARWTKEEVADFVEKIGFPEYRPCFEDNNVSGRQLAYISASTLPKIGIHKFEDQANHSRIPKFDDRRVPKLSRFNFGIEK